MIFEILDDMATKAVKKTEGQITGAAKKIMGNWFSDVTGKTYYNTTRAKAEQYEAASERMRKTPSKYKGWTKKGREAADNGIDITDANFGRIDAGFDVIEDDFSNIPESINYDDLPDELKKMLHDEDIGSDDPVKHTLIEKFGDNSWDNMSTQELKDETTNEDYLATLTELAKYY